MVYGEGMSRNQGQGIYDRSLVLSTTKDGPLGRMVLFYAILQMFIYCYHILLLKCFLTIAPGLSRFRVLKKKEYL